MKESVNPTDLATITDIMHKNADRGIVQNSIRQ